MKILIDIGHPAHVHLFKHFAWEMLDKGHKIIFTCRDKEFEIYLLEKYGFRYNSFGPKRTTVIGKILGLIEFDLKELISALGFKPDIFFSHGSIYAAHAAFLLGKLNIALEDTFNFEQLNLSLPFTHAVLTGDYDHPLKSGKVIKYSGNHELAYLHPSRFQPEKTILDELGLEENEKYIIMRFVSWNASHDIGLSGFTEANKIKAVNEFSKYARVFISAEKELPAELEPYRIRIPPERMHDALAYASLFFGESATMASESAVLGTPTIFLDKVGRGYTNEEEKHGLVCNYKNSLADQKKAIAKGVALLADPNTKRTAQKNREDFLKDKIDVTAFMVWFIENYPESFRIMKERPEYQKRFGSRERAEGRGER